MQKSIVILDGRTCLITGASSGLGTHFARLASAAGGRVIPGARRKDRVEQLADELRAAGSEAIAVSMAASRAAGCSRSNRSTTWCSTFAPMRRSA